MISILIPAARSPKVAQELADALRIASMMELEIIVISPAFAIEGAINVRDSYAGSSRALAIGFTQARGEFIGWLSDECRPTRGCLESMAQFVADHDVPFIGEFNVGDAGCFANTLLYARWGMMARATADLIGFFDPIYSSFFGDVDLSLRCWRAGGKVEICPHAVVQHHSTYDELNDGNAGRSWVADQKEYLARWPEFPL